MSIDPGFVCCWVYKTSCLLTVHFRCYWNSGWEGEEAALCWFIDTCVSVFSASTVWTNPRVLACPIRLRITCKLAIWVQELSPSCKRDCAYFLMSPRMQRLSLCLTTATPLVWFEDTPHGLNYHGNQKDKGIPPPLYFLALYSHCSPGSSAAGKSLSLFSKMIFCQGSAACMT